MFSLRRRKRSNKKDKSTSDSVVDAGTRMGLYKVRLLFHLNYLTLLSNPQIY